MHRLVALVAAAALLVVACGDDDAACMELREPLDPASALHLLDLEGITWQSHPPTSGPHLSGPTPRGPQRAPMGTAVQVSILEGGGAIVQYDPAALSETDVAALEGLATGETVVAPGDSLPAPIVATAWTWKLTCDTPDLDRIRAFTATRPADAPGSD